MILWTGYSEETDAVKIPAMLHFFPMDIVKGEEKTVDIQVAKYYRGKWRSKNFNVCVGEMIGREVEEELSSDDIRRRMMGLGGEGDGSSKKTLRKMKVDYSTGAMLVDVVEDSKWMGVNVLNRRDYADVLFTDDGEEIEHVAVKSRNWPSELQAEFARVKQAELEKVTLVGRGSKKRGRRGGRSRTSPMPMMPGMPGMPGMPFPFMGPGGGGF